MIDILIGVAVAVLALAVLAAIYFAVTSPSVRGKISVKQMRRPEIPTPYGMVKPPSDAELKHARKEHPPVVKCEFCPRAAVWHRMLKFACDVHRKKLKGNPRRIVGQPHGPEKRCGFEFPEWSTRCKLLSGHPGYHWDGSRSTIRTLPHQDLTPRK